MDRDGNAIGWLFWLCVLILHALPWLLVLGAGVLIGRLM